jgi:hypothetical protein
LIAYSLGNKVFETPPGFTPPQRLFSNQALLLDLDLDRTGVCAARMLPLQLSASGKPRVPTRPEADAILRDLQRQSSALGTTLHYTSDEAAATARLR